MSDSSVPMPTLDSLDERRVAIAKAIGRAAVAVLREHGLERGPIHIANHDHLRLILEVGASWVLAAEADGARTLERRMGRSNDHEIDDEREHGRGGRSGGR